MQPCPPPRSTQSVNTRRASTAPGRSARLRDREGRWSDWRSERDRRHRYRPGQHGGRNEGRAEIEAETARGGLAWYAKDVDRDQGVEPDFEVATWDYELLAYAVGGTLITGNGASETTWNTKTIGWAVSVRTATTQPAVAIELWSRAAYSTGACSTITGAPTFIRHIFPRVQMQLTDRAFEAGTPGT